MYVRMFTYIFAYVCPLVAHTVLEKWLESQSALLKKSHIVRKRSDFGSIPADTIKKNITQRIRIFIKTNFN